MEDASEPMESNDAPRTVVLTGTPNIGEAGQASTGPYVQPMMMVQPSNDEATISMVLGIGTWICTILAPLICFSGCLVPLTVIGGIITGHIGMRKSKEMNGLGRTMAIAGLVMNYLFIGLLLAGALGLGIIGSVGI